MRRPASEDELREPELPDAWTEPITVDWPYAPDDLERIRWGCRSTDALEKWFVCCVGDQVLFYRAWTSSLVYRATLTPAGISTIAIDLSLPERQFHISLVRWIVDHILVGLDVEMA